MDSLIYFCGRALVIFIQALSLPRAAKLGRALGGLAYHLTGRYRRVVLQNLTMCYGYRKIAREIQELARENFRRIGESYVCAVKTAAMADAELKPHVEFVGGDRLPQRSGDEPPAKHHRGGGPLRELLSYMAATVMCGPTMSLPPRTGQLQILTGAQPAGHVDAQGDGLPCFLSGAPKARFCARRWRKAA